MSKASLVFASLLLIPSLGTSSSEPAPDKPGVTAQQFVKSYVRAMNRADIAAMMKMVSKSSSVTSIGEGSISHGWRSIQTDAQQFVGRKGSFKFTVGLVEVTTLGPSYVLAVAPFTMQTLGQEEDVELPAAMTFVLERDGKSWKVIHEHWSCKPADEVGEGDPADPEDEGDQNFDTPASSGHDPRTGLTSFTPRPALAGGRRAVVDPAATSSP